MRIQIKNHFNFDLEYINKKFSGGLTFINSFCVGEEYLPVSLYKAAKPDKSKGHKKYMLLQITQGGQGLVRGRSSKEMETERYRKGIHCLNCNEVIFSSYRHDYSTCSCGGCDVDGGKDYFKYGGEDFNIVTVDLLKGKIKL